MVVRRWKPVLMALAAAVWLAVHGWLWSVLPPVPHLRLPAAALAEFGDEGRLLVTADAVRIRRYKTASGRLEREWRFADWLPPGTQVHRLIVSRDGRRAIVYSAEHGHIFTDLDTGRQTPLPTQPYGLGDVRFTPDGRFVVCLAAKPDDRFNALSVWEIDTGRERVYDLSGRASCFDLSADGRMAAVWCSILDAHLRPQRYCLEMLDLNQGRHERRDVTHGNFGGVLAFSPDGRTLVTTAGPLSPSAQWMVSTWTVPDCRQRATMAEARCCGWRENGRLALEREDGTLFSADADLSQIIPLSPARRPGDGLVRMDESGRHLLFGAVQRRSAVLVSVLNRLLAEPIVENWVELTCYDLSGRALARVPSEYYFCAVTPDSQFLAVPSPGERSIDLYTLPTRKAGGFVLALMIAQAGSLTAWTAWRRRRRQSRQPSSGKLSIRGIRVPSEPDA